VSILRSNDGFTSGTAQNLVGSGDQTGFMVTYQAGALGNYYLPTTATQLIDHGSRTADLAGLHHYTTTTGNSKEQNSQVDIGFHYVAAEPDRQGLVAHWRLDEESGTVAQDSSENYLNGALSGASWTSGTLEGAAYFNGSDQYVSVPNSSLLSFPSGSFSISVWVNPQDSLGRAVLAKGEGGQPDWSEYILTVNSGGFWFKGAWRASTALSSVPVGVWTHLVVAFDGTTLRFYKNGTLMNSLVPTGTYATVTSYGFYLSRQGAGGYNNFAGLIDEVRFYSRALSASEVGYLFNKAAYDYDGDGLADYLEDRNGNGVYDAGETDWQTYNSQYGLNGSSVLQVFTPLKP